MYRKKKDLTEKGKGEVLGIYTIHTRFPKRSQRKGMWKKLWGVGGEPGRKIMVGIVNYNLSDHDDINLGESDKWVFGFEIRSLRRKLREVVKQNFDNFYYK